MPIIDRNMYDELKKWCDKADDSIQGNILYVHRRNNTITKATIRKLIFELHEEDKSGELSISLYNAKYFARNMRDYYSHIAELCFHKHTEDETSKDNIKRLSPPYTWVYLLVEDFETLSKDRRVIEEVMRSFYTFSMKGANIILIGDREYKNVFPGCVYAMKTMPDDLATKEEGSKVTVGCYNQERIPHGENEVFKSEENQRNQLCFNWEILLQQLKQNYFDYEVFKILLKETLEYITPRITESMVYRKDLSLLTYIGSMRHEASEIIEGCNPWEYEASVKISLGLYHAIENRYIGDSIGEKIRVIIDGQFKDFESLYNREYRETPIEISVDTACEDIERLSEAIYECMYAGHSFVWNYMYKRVFWKDI